MKKQLTLALSLMVLNGWALAQNPRWEFDISLAGGFPAGDFEDVLDDEGIGAGLRAAYWFGDSPLSLGLDLSFLQYGSRSFHLPHFDETMETTNNIAMGHLTLRWQRQFGTFRPYVEGLIGVKHFETKTEFFQDHYDEPFDSRTEFDDTGFSAGTGIGLSIALKDGGFGPGHDTSVLFRMGCRYLYGSKASYVPEDTIEFDGDTLYFEVLTSKTDLISAEAGFTIKF